ncbi:MAG TPA: carboxypeptidase-like regulatory domain-containing protein [Pirellula sp.]|nr:carboxypeptidase-like regulatory domain-containing protein [Pirellula sp.]
MRNFRICLIASCLSSVFIVGCFQSGPDVGEVSGKVTFKGQPVKEGTVTFLNPSEGGAGESPIDDNGSYAIPKLVVGDYIVIVTPLMEMKDTDPGKSPPAPVEKSAPNIPVKYRQQGLTPLKSAVKKGKNEFQIEMNP